MVHDSFFPPTWFIFHVIHLFTIFSDHCFNNHMWFLSYNSFMFTWFGSHDSFVSVRSVIWLIHSHVILFTRFIDFHNSFFFFFFGIWLHLCLHYWFTFMAWLNNFTLIFYSQFIYTWFTYSHAILCKWFIWFRMGFLFFFLHDSVIFTWLFEMPFVYFRIVTVNCSHVGRDRVYHIYNKVWVRMCNQDILK